MIKKILFGAATLILVLVLAAGIYTWNPLPKTPSATVLSAAASNYDVEIIRDTWGVPHIFGKTDNTITLYFFDFEKHSNGQPSIFSK